MIEEHHAYLIAYKIDQCIPLPCPVFMCNVISVSKTRQARQFTSTPADILCSVLIVAHSVLRFGSASSGHQPIFGL